MAYLAEQSRAQGRQPVHLVLHPCHQANFVAGVPNILFPFWEFPRIPDRDFGFETRQNWKAHESRGGSHPLRLRIDGPGLPRRRRAVPG